MYSRIILLTFVTLFAQQSFGLDLTKDCYCRERSISNYKVVPWIVSIGKAHHDKETNELKWNSSEFYNYPHECTGVVINQDWILTTAGCVLTTEGSTINYGVGVGSELSDIYSKAPLEIGFVKYYQKPNYDGVTFLKLAMLRLKNPLDFVKGGLVEAACLDVFYNKTVEGSLSTAGWGGEERPDFSFDKFESRANILSLIVTKPQSQKDVYNMWTEDNLGRGGYSLGKTGSPLNLIKEDYTYVAGILTIASVPPSIDPKNNYRSMRFSLISGYDNFIKEVVGTDFCSTPSSQL